MAEKIVLENGLRLLVEEMPHLRSVACGLWVDTGSAREERGRFGVSHLLEHMLFKGTQRRTAAQIAAVMDNVGGVLNAFTAKEQTCYYTRCLDEHFPLALDLLADMYHHSRFEPQEVEREKKVVIEEINMYEDSPDDLVLDLFAATLWPGHCYGRSISGSAADVAGLDAAAVRQFWRGHYAAANTVLAVAGNIRRQQVAELAEELFSPAPVLPQPTLTPPQPAAGDGFIRKEIEQTHVCLGFTAPALSDADHYAAAIVNSAFGGSASARLFQEVREKRGLSYSAYSDLESYAQAGFLTAYASTQPANAEELIRVMANEFTRLAEQGLTTEEIRRSKDQLRGSLLLQMESSGSLMSKLGKYELSLGTLYDPRQVADKLLAVTEDEISAVIERMVRPGQMVLAQVGPSRCPLEAKELF